MLIKSNTILAGVFIVLGIIIIVGALRYMFDIIVNPPRDSTEAFGIGGAVGICLGLAPLMYGIVSLRDDLLHGKRVEANEEDEERKV